MWVNRMGCRKKTKKKKIQKKLSKKWKVEKLVLLTRIRVIATDVIEKCEYFSRHIRGDNTNCTQRAATRWRRQTAIQKKKRQINSLSLSSRTKMISDETRNSTSSISFAIISSLECMFCMLLFATRNKKFAKSKPCGVFDVCALAGSSSGCLVSMAAKWK